MLVPHYTVMNLNNVMCTVRCGFNNGSLKHTDLRQIDWTMCPKFVNYHRLNNQQKLLEGGGGWGHMGFILALTFFFLQNL